MATVLFVGGAPAVAQVNTETPANVEVGDEFYVRLENHAGENHEIGFTAANANVQDVVEGLQAAGVAAAAAGIVPWNEVTCTEDDTKMTITGDTAGEPFFVSTRTVEGGGTGDQTLTDANTTAVAGPKIFNTPENWDLGAYLTDDDDVVIRADVTTAIYGDDYTAIKISTLTSEEGFDQPVGSWAHPLQLDCTGKTTKKVYWWGTGASYLDIDGVLDWYINDCGTSADTGLYDLNIIGLECTRLHFQPENSSARCALAGRVGEVFEVDDVFQDDGVLKIGDGVVQTDGSAPIDSYIITGGECDAELTAGITAAYNQGDGGTLRYRGGAIPTMYAWQGTTEYSGAANISTKLHAGSGATVDLSGSKEAITITACDAYADCTIRDPDGRVTWTNGIVTVGCNAENIELVTKPGGTLTPS